MRATEHPLLTVHVLGSAELLAPAHVVIPLRQPLARALAVRLGLARGRAVADDILIRDLWGDDDAARPHGRLRVLASRLRGALGEHAEALRRTAAGFSLDAAPADLDAAERALGTVEAIRRSSDQARVFAAASGALALWRGDPLADLTGIPFVAAERRRLESLQLELQLAWAAAGLVLGQPIGPELERLVRIHPLHERLVGLSARALALAGQPANALDRLQELRTRLVEQLGIDPTAETVALEADLRGARPPAARMPLPMASRSFVGREQEQSVLLAETRAPGLITLLGGPGAGKTRLAREIAGRTTESGRPVAWLDLAPLRPGDDLVGALAAAVGATTADRSIGHSAELLTGALLVLDNAEHLVEEITAVVEALRFKAIDLSIVITSQRALRLSDERIERIGPLTAAAAEQLFCDRSGTGPSAAVARICAAVDRLPLGIELAAGLTRTLSVDQLADRIDQRLRLLVRGLRDAGTRHISLRSALDWSHELLEPRVRIALRRLSVFAGGCTPQAASAVLAGDGIDADQVAGLLTELVDRSLVTLDDGRFGLLETVREYALDQLRSSGEENAVRRKHADWCAQLATTGRPDGPLHRGPLFGRPELAHLMRLEEPNLLAAIDWCLQDGNDPGRVGDIVSPLSWHWAFRGLMQQAHTWLQASLDALPTGTPRRAQVLHGLAVLSRSIGRYDDAFAAGLECLEIRESLGDDRGIASICQMLTLISVAQGKAYAALNFGHRAELLARELGMPVALGASLNCSGLALRELGYPVEAKRMFEEAYELWTSAGNDEGVVIASGNLGIMAILAGDFAEARRLTLFGLRKARGIGYLLGLLETLVQLARIEVAEGNYARAVRVLAVIDRERAEKQTPIVVPDELAAFAAAWEDCRAALGVEADRLAELARHQSADALVAEILSS